MPQYYLIQRELNNTTNFGDAGACRGESEEVIAVLSPLGCFPGWFPVSRQQGHSHIAL